MSKQVGTCRYRYLCSDKRKLPASNLQLELTVTDQIENVIQIRDVSKVEPLKRSLRIHMHEQGQRPITLQLGSSSVKKLATLLEAVFDDDNRAAQRGKRLVKLGRLKETYGACMVADLLTRYPEYNLDELERDLSNFSYN
jgi:hypothetical protein